jgi:branched-chain amino acid transport system permease protein
MNKYGWLSLLGLILITQIFFVDQIDLYALKIINFAGINIILAVSLNLINGFTGQFSMGHAGFMAIGAYTAGATSLYFKNYFPALIEDPILSHAIFLFVIIFAALLSAVAGLLIGLPTLRLKGDYLAIVTLGFGEIIRVLILNIEALGAARGLPGVPALNTFTWTYVLALGTIFFIARYVNSKQGRELLAVREDEIAAQAIGVNTTKAKILSFIIGASFAGIAGALFAHEINILTPTSYDIQKSFEIIIMVVLGGMGSISGSVFAAILLTALPEALRGLEEYRMLIYSLMLIVLMLGRPRGIFGNKELSDFLPNSIKKFLYSSNQNKEALS